MAKDENHYLDDLCNISKVTHKTNISKDIIAEQVGFNFSTTTIYISLIL